MNKLFFVVGIILLAITGCQQPRKITKYYEDGQLKETYYLDRKYRKQGANIEYYPSGNISFESYYTNGKFLDTLYFYFDNIEKQIEETQFYLMNNSIFYKKYHKSGKLHRVGVFDKNDQKTGIWKNYDKDGHHTFTKEYKIIDGKEYTNQMWVTLPGGDTLTESVSIHYHFDKKRVQLTDSIYCFFQIENSAFSKEEAKTAAVSVTLPKDYTQENFTADFSNRPKSPFGTTKTKDTTVINISSLDKQRIIPIEAAGTPKEALHQTVAFYWKPKRMGRDTIRGYVVEMISFIDKNNPANKKQDSIRTELSKDIYFDVPVEVIK
ncbi:toxin-antitoxin system YwqK family antitoxin [Aquimarina hainanensis]